MYVEHQNTNNRYRKTTTIYSHCRVGTRVSISCCKGYILVCASVRIIWIIYGIANLDNKQGLVALDIFISGIAPIKFVVRTSMLKIGDTINMCMSFTTTTGWVLLRKSSVYVAMRMSTTLICFIHWLILMPIRRRISCNMIC